MFDCSRALSEASFGVKWEEEGVGFGAGGGGGGAEEEDVVLKGEVEEERRRRGNGVAVFAAVVDRSSGRASDLVVVNMLLTETAVGFDGNGRRSTPGCSSTRSLCS